MWDLIGRNIKSFSNNIYYLFNLNNNHILITQTYHLLNAYVQEQIVSINTVKINW